MGRKATFGNRSTGGRKKKPSTEALRQKWDYGNDRLKARFDAFTHPALHGGKAGGEAHDPLGMLYATLWLESHGHDSGEMVRIAREYAELFYERFSRTGGGINMEPGTIPRGSGRPPETSQPEGRSERYCRIDQALGCGPERESVRNLVIGFYGTDEVPPWVQRLVNERRRRLKLSVAGWTAMPEDYDRLACLIRGLCRMVDGVVVDRRRAA